MRRTTALLAILLGVSPALAATGPTIEDVRRAASVPQAIRLAKQIPVVKTALAFGIRVPLAQVAPTRANRRQAVIESRALLEDVRGLESFTAGKPHFGEASGVAATLFLEPRRRLPGVRLMLTAGEERYVASKTVKERSPHMEPLPTVPGVVPVNFRFATVTGFTKVGEATSKVRLPLVATSTQSLSLAMDLLRPDFANANSRLTPKQIAATLESFVKTLNF
jgi:hypothetical protein